MPPASTDPSPRAYVEPGRTFTTALVLSALLTTGFLLDFFAVGAGVSHLAAWVLAFVLVVGIDLLGTYAARRLRTIVVTSSTLTVGEESLPREDIVAVEEQPDEALPVLGRRYNDGVPRGQVGVGLRLADGRRVVVATRHADRLVAALEVETAGIEVRPAEPADLPLLAEIDDRAEMLFRVYGMELPEIPTDPAAIRNSEMVFVAGRPPVAFVQIDAVDGQAHVEELAVLPSHMRQGLGSALLAAAVDWAETAGYAAVTLCTYVDVPWNGPFYAARGFAEVDAPTPGLAERRAREQALGLDALGRRCVMRRTL